MKSSWLRETRTNGRWVGTRTGTGVTSLYKYDEAFLVAVHGSMGKMKSSRLSLQPTGNLGQADVG